MYTFSCSTQTGSKVPHNLNAYQKVSEDYNFHFTILPSLYNTIYDNVIGIGLVRHFQALK